MHRLRIGLIRHLDGAFLGRSPRLYPTRNVLIYSPRRQFVQVSNLPTSPEDGNGGSNAKESGNRYREVLWKVFEAASTTLITLLLVGACGYGYYRFYKSLVLRKIEQAFAPGDPVLELANVANNESANKLSVSAREEWLHRPEQLKIDAIVNGTLQGRYHLFLGEKGTGKSSMILAAMQKVNGDGIAMFECHADLEVFRVRLGRALNFEYHEDYIGSLFSIKGPRDTTALLDIERAFNKLEKVALKRRATVGRPLVLIMNAAHLIRDDEDGRDLLELVQQRAEQWAASNLVTLVMNSDEYWVYERLKQLATRLEVTAVQDLPRQQALIALKEYRTSHKHEPLSSSMADEIFALIGGRLAFLTRIARRDDALAACKTICQAEKTWLLNQTWILGEEMDDDVMDQQKYCAAAMVLAKALVDKEAETNIPPSHPDYRLPEIPLHEARQIMTRADFIQDYDAKNIFTIDAFGMVRADSVPMQNAFREICSSPGFSEHLAKTLDRIAAIESLGRTRELVAKDLIDKAYQITSSDSRDSKSTKKTRVQLSNIASDG